MGAVPRPPLTGAVVAGVLVVGLSGCQGTPWAERFSRSFSAAPETGAEAPAASGSSQAPLGNSGPRRAAAEASPPQDRPAGRPTAAATSQMPPPPAQDRRSSSPPGPAPKPPSGAAAGQPSGQLGRSSEAERSSPAASPLPYRVTIRLPQADPSAPAEVVTRALRAAGVPFEVETIERIPSSAAAAAPTVRPAPNPGPLPAR